MYFYLTMYWVNAIYIYFVHFLFIINKIRMVNEVYEDGDGEKRMDIIIFIHE